ncbi:hypothetical protein [Salinilacihabitans rarus]|uniref:hypothetical protein n=1 Tax=Salinilacihabitans rarus TaxID=2961596 RepID=UPI0020C8F806|nr:hypothetical protein [Salinilacihabitans rarus]
MVSCDTITQPFIVQDDHADRRERSWAGPSGSDIRSDQRGYGGDGFAALQFSMDNLPKLIIHNTYKIVKRSSRMKIRRRALLGATTLSITSFSGCLSSRMRTKPAVLHDGGTTTYEPVVEGQPTIEDGVPSVWGRAIASPEAARQHVNWQGETPNQDEDPTVAAPVEFRTFDEGDRCLTIVVGVLPTEYGLVGYDDEDGFHENIVEDFKDSNPVIKDGRLHYHVEPYTMLGDPENELPDYHYDYSFHLWDLNGHEPFDEVIVTLHGQ